MGEKKRVVGVNFDHMHMGDNLRFAHDHPGVELVGISDERPERMETAASAFGLTPSQVFTDWRACMESTDPELVILCPATGEHALWVERISDFGCHVLLEKPFASDLADADAIVQAMTRGGGMLAVNWPLAWYPPHVTAKRLIDEGHVGGVQTVNYYDGNRGPLYHVEAKIETSAEFRAEEKAQSWFYKRRRLYVGLLGVWRDPRHLVYGRRGAALCHRRR